MKDELNILFSRILRRVVLWASESFLTSLLVLAFAFVIILPLIEYLQELVRSQNYFKIIESIFHFLRTNITGKDTFYTILFILILFLLYSLKKEIQKTKVVNENFSKNLNKWTFSRQSSWTIHKREDGLGKFLRVTNSSLPGLMKDCYGWYDYEATFHAKMSPDTPEKRQNVTFVVRAENNFNGVMLQVTKTHLRPHLIHDGTFFIDDKNIFQLPTVLKAGEWISVKTVIKANTIDIFLNEYHIFYRIPSESLKVENSLLGTDLSITSALENDKKIISQQRATLNIYEQHSKETNTEARGKLMQEFTTSMALIPNFTTVNFDFYKGSFGFRESGEEETYFRDLVIKKIE